MGAGNYRRTRLRGGVNRLGLIMLAFIIACVTLAILVSSQQNEFLALLVTPAGLGTGLVIMFGSLIAGYYKKVSSLSWHDGFATGGLLVWYAYWQPQFSPEAPMFFWYPVYFALLTSILTLSLINKAAYFDVESVLYLRQLEKLSRFSMAWLIALVFAGLLITRHYALYAMAMTFFIVRHTMLICMEKIDQID